MENPVNVSLNVARRCVAQTYALVPGLGIEHYNIVNAIRRCFNSLSLKKTIIFSGSVLLCYKMAKFLYSCRLDINRWFIKYCMSSRSVDERETFKNLDLGNVHHNLPKAHSHPKAATLRCQANTLMSAFITDIGRVEYSISRSKSEQDRKISGSRDYYHAKDLQMEHSSDHFDYSLHVMKATDVDYYLDMPKILDGKHFICYTFNPTTAAGSTTEGTFKFENNEVVLRMDGGAQYKHPLWDYETDHLLVDHWWGSAMYLVESRKISDDRRVVYFNPIRNVFGPWAWFIPGERLKHRSITQGGINYITHQRTEQATTTLFHSFSEIGTTTCVTIPDAVLQSITRRFIHQDKPAMSDLERILRNEFSDDTKNATTGAAILFNILKNQPELLHIAQHTVPRQITNGVERKEDNHTYQTTDPIVTEDAKPTMRSIFTPYLPGYAPGKSFNNDTATVQGRIEKPRCKVSTFPPFYHQCLREFVQHLIPESSIGLLSPSDMDFSYTKLKRATQRSLFQRIKALSFLDNPWVVKSFQKAEAAAKIAFPRNIATLPTEHNVRLGQFCYPLSDAIFKKTSWYLFGSTPDQIAERMHNYVQGKQWVVPTDYSKMDATTAPIHTLLMETIFRRAYAPQYHVEIKRLIQKETHAKAFTKFGVQYSTGYMTNSGSSMTSIRNSAINAFNAYVVLRYDNNPDEAYQRLGLYGGDDGITADVSSDLYVRVTAKLGQKLKAEVIQPNNPVPLLGRIFIDPWTTKSSIADVPRQLKKLHLTSAPLEVPDEIVMLRRAEGFLITDPETPIISHWSRAVQRICKTYNQDQISLYEKKYGHHLEKVASYASTQGVWPKLDDIPLAKRIVSDMLGNHAADVSVIEQLMDNASNLDELHFGLIIDEDTIAVEVTATLGHRLVDPPQTGKGKRTPKPKKNKPREPVRAKNCKPR
jgi:hypothetical protein